VLLISNLLNSDVQQDSHTIQEAFSAEKQPTLWRAIPALEELMLSWEDKIDDGDFADYHDALCDGIAKIKKYYCKFDEKPAFILALHKSFSLPHSNYINCILVLHPYYTFRYIKLAWGGEEERLKEIENGNLDAKNWQDEAVKVLEQTVRITYSHIWQLISFNTDGEILEQPV
jgi:hypothetical protein